MNNQIKQLYGQALDRAVPETWTTLSPQQLEKFAQALAEVVIKEAFVVLTPYMDDQFINDIEAELNQHFGIEDGKKY